MWFRSVTHVSEELEFRSKYLFGNRYLHEYFSSGIPFGGGLDFFFKGQNENPIPARIYAVLQVSSTAQEKGRCDIRQ